MGDVMLLLAWGGSMWWWGGGDQVGDLLSTAVDRQNSAANFASVYLPVLPNVALKTFQSWNTIFDWINISNIESFGFSECFYFSMWVSGCFDAITRKIFRGLNLNGVLFLIWSVMTTLNYKLVTLYLQQYKA